MNPTPGNGIQVAYLENASNSIWLEVVFFDFVA